MGNKRIKVLIVDDSIFFREILSSGLKPYEFLEIVGTAVDAEDASIKIQKLKPDVLTLDVEMPKMNGIDFLKQLMQGPSPLPVIMVSSLNMRVFDTLAAGAVDFVKKPDSKQSEEMNNFFRDLANKLKIAAVAKLPKARVNLANTNSIKAPKPVIENKKTTTPTVNELAKTKSTTALLPKLVNNKLGHARFVIALGASTGGTEAILSVVSRLPAQMPGIVITQHMPPGFTKMFAERMNRICALEVKEAADNDVIRPGLVLIAPGGVQMQVVKRGNGYAVKCAPGEKVSGHCPSVDVLFQSMATAVGRDGVGVIMTGMGADGANGLLAMKESGAYTIGQDKESSVVYGMPMEAFNRGAVLKQAALENIAAEILQYLRLKGC